VYVLLDNAVSSLDFRALNDSMIVNSEMEGVGPGLLFEVPSLNLSGGTEENHEVFESR
jgi:hypothetical protein